MTIFKKVALLLSAVFSLTTLGGSWISAAHAQGNGGHSSGKHKKHKGKKASKKRHGKKKKPNTHEAEPAAPMEAPAGDAATAAPPSGT